MMHRYGLHLWTGHLRKEVLVEMGQPRRKEIIMTNESENSVAKGARLAMLTLALVLPLAMLQAFSAKPASANVNLLPGSGGNVSSDKCPPGGFAGYPNGLPPLSAVNWTGTNADELRCGSTGVAMNGTTYGGDTLNGMGGSDQLFGLGQNDKLYGGTGNDKLYGQTGKDEIVPGDGADYVAAGWQSDTVIAYADGQKDIFYADPVGGSEYEMGSRGLDPDGIDVLKITSCGGLDSADEVHNFELVSRPSC